MQINLTLKNQIVGLKIQSKYFKAVIIIMKSQLKVRPQSKRLSSTSRQPKLEANIELAQQFFNKAKIEQGKESYQCALDYYKRATNIKPTYFQAFCNMGYCYRALGNYQSAKKAYLNALYINPQDAITHYNFANLYRITGENEYSIKEYQFVIMLKEGKNVDVGSLYLNSLINISICYKNLGLIEEAIEVNEKAYRISSNEESITFNLAMCILNSIQFKNSSIFNKFCQERATRAKQLFDRSLQINPNNNMARLSLIKLSNILNNKQDNIQKSIQQLKTLLEGTGNQIKGQINQYQAYCLSLLKKYQQSSRLYQHQVDGIIYRSMKKDISTPRSPISPISNLFPSFEPERPSKSYIEQEFLTESEGIRLIQAGQQKLLLQKVKSMSNDNPVKNTLLIILYLTKAENEGSQQYLRKADYIYINQFQRYEFDQFGLISLEGHKAIGKLLTLKGDYQQSIAHYEYIASNINDNRSVDSAKMHNSIGQGYQGAGNIERAIEEYKKALQIQPDNFSISYSIGYCLFENQKYYEATQYFSNIIHHLKQNYNIDEEVKQLYQVDCRIILAMSCERQEDKYLLYQQAFIQLNELKDRNNLLELEQDNLNIFFSNLAEIYERRLQINGQSLQKNEITKKLLKCYEYLLQFQNCADKNEILINSGNLYYGLKQYCASIQAYTQVTQIRSEYYLNISLAYCHLIEPSMAAKYIYQAQTQAEKEKTSLVLIMFVREIIEWMNNNENVGIWGVKLPTVRYDMFYERYEFGLAIIDKLTELINQQSIQDQQQLLKSMQSLIVSYQTIQFNDKMYNIKFTKLKQFIKGYSSISNSDIKNVIPEDLLKFCFRSSSNILEDFPILVKMLKNFPSCGKQAEYSEAMLYLFIYHNGASSHLIIEQMKKFIDSNKSTINVKLEKIIDHNEEEYSILPDFSDIKSLINLLREWEAILQPKTLKIIQTIEKVYYNGDVIKPIQTQYHFPRHSHLLQCDQTVEKLMNFVFKVAKYNSEKIRCRSKNTISEMKKDLIKQFQNQFNSEIKEIKMNQITISQDFLPATLYVTHKSKRQAQNFINQIITLGSHSAKIQIQQFSEMVIIFNRLVRVVCRWSDPFNSTTILKEVMENIVEDPLYIGNQAILYLQKLIQVVKEDSQMAAAFVKEDSTFRK